MRIRSFIPIALILCLQGLAPGQLVSLNTIRPEAAAGGDPVTLRGTGFLSATQVRFIATVGGFTGQFPVTVPVTPTSDTELKVVLPTFGNFILPPAPNPGQPLGFVDVIDSGGGFSNQVALYYMEGDTSGVTTVATGSTNTTGCRGAASFTIMGGAPVSGNSGFVFTGENLPVGSVCYAVVGSPPSVQIPVLDGVLPFDPVLPFNVPFSDFSSTDGRVSILAPIPPITIGSTFSLSWVYIDAASFAVHVTNGLQFTL